MRAFLTIQKGPATGMSIVAEDGAMFRVGRQASADLTIAEDRALSGLHFAFQCDGGTCRIRDLSSTNGTFVNGIRVNLVELHHRDTIRAGNSEFEVRFEGEFRTTVSDPLMYPEIRFLREQDERKKASPADKNETSSESDRPSQPFHAESTVRESSASDSSASEFEATDALDFDSEGQELESACQKEPAQREEELSIRHLNVFFADASGDRQIWLRPGQTVIVGRNQMADVLVTGDKAVSGVHFALDCESTRCRIRDLQSQNGLKLNDVAIPYATIYDGDKFVAGKTTFQVSVEGGQDAPDASLRTWVFEDWAKRKFATFHAEAVGSDHHLVDSIGSEPYPIEFMRRLARYRELGVLIDSSLVDPKPWYEASGLERPSNQDRFVMFCVDDFEKIVDPVRAAWGKDGLVLLLPNEVQVDLLHASVLLIEQLTKAADRPNNTSVMGKMVRWLSHQPDRLETLLENIEAIVVEHSDSSRWRILCETNFITNLNRLGYMPSKPMPHLEMNRHDSDLAE